MSHNLFKTIFGRRVSFSDVVPWSDTNWYHRPYLLRHCVRSVKGTEASDTLYGV